MTPELRQLRYFVSVAEELSYTRAAERLHVAPQTLSAAIQQLEAMLGVRLLERTTRRVELTEAGEAMLPEARAALSRVDAAVRAARHAAGLEGAGVRVGFSPRPRTTSCRRWCGRSSSGIPTSSFGPRTSASEISSPRFATAGSTPAWRAPR